MNKPIQTYVFRDRITFSPKKYSILVLGDYDKEALKYNANVRLDLFYFTLGLKCFCVDCHYFYNMYYQYFTIKQNRYYDKNLWF